MIHGPYSIKYFLSTFLIVQVPARKKLNFLSFECMGYLKFHLNVILPKTIDPIQNLDGRIFWLIPVPA